MNINILSKKYNINGPNNVARLTDGNKIIYIFADVHNEPNNQHECEYSNKIESIDIDKFLIKFFKIEKKKEFDIYIENYIDKIDKKNYENYNYKDNYILQVMKIIEKEIEIKNNKIIKSKEFPNIRFHYFDIRNTIKIYETLLILINNIAYNFENIIYDINIINDTMTDIIYNYNELLKYFLSNENKYINKIKNIYKDNKIKNKINEVFNDYIIEYIKDNIKLCDETIKYIKNNNINKKKRFFDNYDDLIFIIYKNIKKINDINSKIFSILTDLYLLRRILDRNYTKNNIIYTGAFHFVDIINILVKYFNFEITHIYNTDIKEATKIIKENNFENNFENLKNLLYLFNENDITQCINLFDFPDNFN